MSKSGRFFEENCELTAIHDFGVMISRSYELSYEPSHQQTRGEQGIARAPKRKLDTTEDLLSSKEARHHLRSGSQAFNEDLDAAEPRDAHQTLGCSKPQALNPEP